MKTHTYTQAGETWETRGSIYSYYNGQPCKIIELRGNIDTFAAPDTIRLGSEPIGDGWVRYYLDSSDPGFHDSIADLARLYNKKPGA